MKPYLLKYSPSRFFLWIGAVFFLTSCASPLPPKRTVYIPPEYQKPLPRSGSSSRVPGSLQPKSGRLAPESTPQAPIVEPPPDIAERDLTLQPREKPPVQAGTPSAAAREPVRTQEEQPQSEPQQLASMHIVDQGKAALNQGNVDQAISLFEQAVQVDVYNGDAFYGLAQAWRMKGALDKSLEFANKAGVIYQNDPSKLKKVYLLQTDIYTTLHEHEKAEMYRRKASEL